MYTGVKVPAFAILNKLFVIPAPLYTPPLGPPTKEILPDPEHIVLAGVDKVTVGKAFTPTVKVSV